MLVYLEMFYQKHGFLSLLTISLGIVCFFLQSMNLWLIRHISSQVLVALMNKENCLIIDLRPFALYRQKHILFSTHCDKAVLKKMDWSQYSGTVVIITTGLDKHIFNLALFFKKQKVECYALEDSVETWHMNGFPIKKSL